MADEVDVTAERMQAEESMFVAEVCRQAKFIPKGEPGECFYCGEDFERVVAVVDPDTTDVVKSCGRCRDRRNIK